MDAYNYMVFLFLVSATLLEDRPLQAVYIYFDKATFGEIEREEKKTLEASFG